MSAIDEIMQQADEFALVEVTAAKAPIHQRRAADACRAEERTALRNLIAASIADARREGAS